jgi:hypothetical protein
VELKDVIGGFIGALAGNAVALYLRWRNQRAEDERPLSAERRVIYADFLAAQFRMTWARSTTTDFWRESQAAAVLALSSIELIATIPVRDAAREFAALTEQQSIAGATNTASSDALATRREAFLDAARAELKTAKSV